MSRPPISPNPSAPGSSSPGPVPRVRRIPWGLLLLILLVVAGGVLERMGVLEPRDVLSIAEGYSGHWWLAPALALAMAALYATGMPGSWLFWVAGVVYPPSVATPVVVFGGLAGALGAYGLARASRGRRGEEEGDSRLVALFSRRSDFSTLLAVRVAPGFPHSAINFAAGLLRVPLVRFAAASGLGLAIKGLLYVTAIHQASHAARLEEVVSWRMLAPLAGLAAILLFAPSLVRAVRSHFDPVVLPVEED